MSKWIDADEIGNVKFQEENLRGMGEHIAYRVGWNEAIESILENAPSIDIVWCKECRHWCCHNDVDYDQSKFTYYCEVHGISLKGNEFCSYGERKESE